MGKSREGYEGVKENRGRGREGGRRARGASSGTILPWKLSKICRKLSHLRELDFLADEEGARIKSGAPRREERD